MQESCTAESTAGNVELSYFDSAQACLSACTELPETTGTVHYSSSATADPTSFVGNSVFCRTYHVAAALEDDAPDEHCPHAMGGDPCIDE
jgi:C4-dicarboxylate-specific signal transduction histidine kinase